MAFDSNGNWYDGRCVPHSRSYLSERTFYKDTALACNKKLADGEATTGKLGKTGNIFTLQKKDGKYLADVWNNVNRSSGVGVSPSRINALKKACKDAGVSIIKDWGKNSSYRNHQYYGGE